MVPAWSDPASRVVNSYGSKACIGESKDSYSDWRRTVGHRCYAQDIDWVEWRLRGTEPVLVAVVETTFYEDKPHMRHLLPRYCAAALARFKRDAQHHIVMMVAERLCVPAYFVVARYDLAMFQVCRLADEAWREMDEATYRRWLVHLYDDDDVPLVRVCS